MKLVNKILLLFMCLVMMLPMVIPTEVEGWDYSGIGGGGTGGVIGGGSWNSRVIGVRATAVTANGKRLSLTVDGTTYISRSIDYYGSLSQISSGYLANVRTSSPHSVCRLANGTTTLCSKPELESGRFEGQNGGYQYEQWPYQDVLPLPVGYDISTGGNPLSSVLSKMGTTAYKSQADDLFERLMGHSAQWFKDNAQGDCEEMQEKLTQVFIIFEPLSQISFVGTASELALLYYATSTYNWAALQQIYNLLRVNPSTGNLGLTYFNPVNAMPVNSVAAKNAVIAAKNNTHDGYGAAILAYSDTFLDEEDLVCDYDYSYTAACANCDNTNSDYLAYTIKDTDNWDGIMASGSSDYSNIQGYFSQGSYGGGDIYCREEFSVYFPNQLSQIYVEPGRYFVLNPEETELSNLNSVGASAIPNLKPYKVYRKRECRAEVNLTRGEKESEAAYNARVLSAKRTALSAYESAKKEDFASDMGKVWFRYNETYEDSKYNMDEPDEMQLYDVYESNPLTDYKNALANVADDDAQLTMENTTKYKLPEEYYRYIRLRDGLSMSKVPSEPYKEVGIANLPVSFENHGVKINATQYKAADIQFAYDLPANAMLGKAATNDGYLATSLGDGGSGGDCIAKSTIEGDPTDGYSCIVLTSTLPTTPPDTDDECDSPEDASKLGVAWNEKHGYCCPAGTSYNATTGECYSEPGDDDGGCKTEEDANRLGVDWNPMTRSCCAQGTTYNPEKGKCVPGDDNTTDPVCPTSECEYGCCPSGECAPMATIDGEPFCPGFGSVDVIYRTIDLEEPFPGQNAEKRETGSNWCSYNIRTQQIDCAYNNTTVKTYITREKNSKKNGYKVYDNDHILYEVNLDSKTITSIRRYNDKNKYDDDWISECYDNGKACKSKFLKEYSSVITGKCKSTSSSNFYTCDKDV